MLDREDAWNSPSLTLGTNEVPFPSLQINAQSFSGSRTLSIACTECVRPRNETESYISIVVVNNNRAFRERKQTLRSIEDVPTVNIVLRSGYPSCEI
jgi:hypothetical protein